MNDPNLPESKPLSPFIPWLWIFWVGGFLLWTTALLIPVPSVSPLEINNYRIDLKFVLGKTLHLSVYAALTFLSGMLKVSSRYRWLLMFFLMGHASLTEFLQSLESERTGQLTDVLLNQIGICVGMLLSWRWWTASESRV